MTLWDKLTTQKDRDRVYNRVVRETEGMFQSVLPISLTDALAAEDDYDAWERSGAAELMETLSSLIAHLNNPSAALAAPAVKRPMREPEPVRTARPLREARPAQPAAPRRVAAASEVADFPSNIETLAGASGMSNRAAPEEPEDDNATIVRIRPRRVKLERAPRHARPARSARM